MKTTLDTYFGFKLHQQCVRCLKMDFKKGILSGDYIGNMLANMS